MVTHMNHLNLKHTHFDTISSTQLYAREQYSYLKPGEWTLFTAKGQTRGIATKDKSWNSPHGLNLYATYSFLIEEKDSAKMLYMPHVTCLQVAKLLESQGINPSIKWVNDVLINQKKVCGILAESFSNSVKHDGINYTAVLIGIGININSDVNQVSQISQPATSIKIETQKEHNIEKLTNILSDLLMSGINTLLTQGFVELQSEINKRLEKFGNMPVILEKSLWKYTVGYIHEVGNDGQLILHKGGNLFENCYSGSILRGEELRNSFWNPEVIKLLMQLQNPNAENNDKCILKFIMASAFPKKV
jgi:BirA family biotin operon repressor/biotin-[acetyl-CoA-carboxylase] ligase